MTTHTTQKQTQRARWIFTKRNVPTDFMRKTPLTRKDEVTRQKQRLMCERGCRSSIPYDIYHGNALKWCNNLFHKYYFGEVGFHNNSHVFF